MNRKLWFMLIYGFVLLGFAGSAIGLGNAVTVMSESVPPDRDICFVIDAGHGGEDGGATSCTGLLESNINLEISLRLNDLMHLLGLKTRMIRTTDISVYTEGETIAAKKVSDLKERVRIINSTKNAVLVSIHQNYFEQEQYAGAQVFYGKNESGKLLAMQIQNSLVHTLNSGSKRTIKPAAGIYLMQHVTCPAILIECGFLSNFEEEFKLRDPQYQKNLCCVIAAELAVYANT